MRGMRTPWRGGWGTNLTLNGGIFMGQTGCRTSGGICSLTILENLAINFSTANDKFRGTSLTSIGSNINSVQFNLSVGGAVVIGGVNTAEITSAASAGKENILVTGDLSIEGGSVSFNYGAPAGAHEATIKVDGNLLIKGGTTYFSRNNGPSTISVGKNFEITQGTCIVKGADSIASVNIAGRFIQKGGLLYMHNNGTTASTTSIAFNVAGNFEQSDGIFNFDSNPSSASASHYLNISSPVVWLSGGTITRAPSPVAGRINFTGTTQFKRTGNAHQITQVKQTVSNGSTLTVTEGFIQVTSISTMTIDVDHLRRPIGKHVRLTVG
jgi:hypothetical protein